MMNRFPGSIDQSLPYSAQQQAVLVVLSILCPRLLECQPRVGTERNIKLSCPQKIIHIYIVNNKKMQMSFPLSKK